MNAWWNDYIGIPYKLKGRDRTGIDCWGLVRLIYSEQYGKFLPSYDVDYSNSNDQIVKDLFSAGKDTWKEVDVHQEGDVCLFRVFGAETHVGIMLSDDKFIHAIQGNSVGIESILSSKWNKRFVGYYRFVEDAEINARPFPLKTEAVQISVSAGKTLQEAVSELENKYALLDNIRLNRVIFLNGKIIGTNDYSSIVLKHGDHIDYKVIPTGSQVGRMAAMFAIMVFAQWAAPLVVSAQAGTMATLTGTQLFVAQTAAFAITQVGALLVNRIFPIREPKENTPGQATKLLQGGQNQKNPYGAIPVVLGRMRYAPPVAANTYTEASGSNSYLRMLLCWGYGPVDVSEIKINDIELSKFSEVEYITLDGTTVNDSYDNANGTTEANLAQLDRLYGQDVSQQVFNQELTCKSQHLATVTVINNNTARIRVNNRSKSLTHQLSLNDKVVIYLQEPILETVIVDDGAHQTNVIGTTVIYDGVEQFTVSNVSIMNTTTNTVDLEVFEVTSTTLNYFVGKPTTVTNIYHEPGGLQPYGYFRQLPAYTYYTVGSVGSEVDRIDVLFNMPQGLYAVDADGNDVPKDVIAKVLIRQTQPTLGPWNPAASAVVSPLSITLPNSYYNVNDDADLEAVYRWHYIVVDRFAKLVVKSGAFTTDPNQDVTGNLLSRLQQENFGNLLTTYGRIPALDSQDEVIWRICTYGNKIVRLHDDRTSAAVTGCSLRIQGNEPTIPGNNIVDISIRNIRVLSGTITRISVLSENKFTLPSGELELLQQVRKNGFFETVSLNVSKGVWEVAVRRVNSNTWEVIPTVDSLYLVSISGFRNSKPVTPPKYTDYSGQIKTLPLALTALRIKATDQLNGNLDGIEGTVVSYGEDLVYSSTYPFGGNGTDYQKYSNAQWTANLPIRNPAALFRHVLRHPANAKASSVQIDDLAIKDWYHYCRQNKFTFDAVIADNTSMLEVLKDIAAAGRASPSIVDGKWTVVIDRVKPNISQIFTPHNSWGFEGARSFSQLPHAFRVNFINSKKGFQPDELIVYNDGYTASNSTLYETIELPGITTPDLVFKHARFHLAQAKLRPETYTLNVDIENLICTRGDRVKVCHYVPKWGIGSGRIKTRISSTVFEVDEPIAIDNASNYIIKIRGDTQNSDGSILNTDRNIEKSFTISSISRTNNIVTAEIVDHPLSVGDYVSISNLSSVSGNDLNVSRARVLSVAANSITYTKAGSNIPAVSVNGTCSLLDGYYSKIKVNSACTISQANAGFLFITGLQTEEFADLLIQGIEPLDNLSARIVLTDYSPAVFNSDTEIIPAFDSKITLAPELRALRIQTKPTIDSSNIVSDETVMELLAPNTYRYRMRVPFSQAPISQAINWELTGVEGQIALNNTDTWENIVRVSMDTKSIIFDNVQEGKVYKIRARYTSDSGRFGPWSDTVTHTIVGRTNPPSTPSNFQAVVELDKLRLTWAASPEPDVAGYEIRTSNNNWGSTSVDPVYRGANLTTLINQPNINTATTYYIKAFDVLKKYSTTAASVAFTRTAPLNVTAATVTRSGTSFLINVISPSTLPQDFSHFEIQVAKNVSSGDIWDTAGVQKVISGTAKASIDILGFSTPRLATNPGMPYRIAIRMVNHKGDKSASSFLVTRYIRTLR